jgi:hypothetical protein
MVRHRIERMTRLLSATAYLLALVASNLPHVHVHALAEAGPNHSCATAIGDDLAHHDHSGDDDATVEGRCHEPADVPASDDDCNICRFLGRPILLVRPFELAEISEQVIPLPAMRAPAVQPIILVVMQARAPPYVALSI